MEDPLWCRKEEPLTKSQHSNQAMKMQLWQISNRFFVNLFRKRRSTRRRKARFKPSNIERVPNVLKIRLSVFETGRLFWQKFLFALLSSSSFVTESGLCQTLSKWCRPTWRWGFFIFDILFANWKLYLLSLLDWGNFLFDLSIR